MRDLVLTIIIFGSIPKLLFRPDLAVLMFYWISLMNPHRMCWGFAVNMQFAFVTAITLLISLLLWKGKKNILWMPANVLLFLYTIWMTITTIFAFDPIAAWTLWDRMWRIQLITFITMIVMITPININRLVWVVSLSLGFYGIKGGIFTVLTGGGQRVWGPDGSFIGGNNEIGLALCMTVPLLRYLSLLETKAYVKQGLMVAMILTLITILGTQSRGALIGMISMITFLIFKSRQKILLTILMLIAIPIIIAFMPESWHERMSTIKEYSADASALGRINAWGAAINIALNHVTGGGFKGLPIPWVFEKYASNPLDIHDAHSIYFQVLAEHGFIGLGFFLAIAFSSWRLASSLMKLTKNKIALQWIYDLSSMIQLSFIGYWSAGSFLGLADFDLYYCLISILVGCKTYLVQYEKNPQGLLDPINSEHLGGKDFVKPVVKKVI